MTISTTNLGKHVYNFVADIVENKCGRHCFFGLHAASEYYYYYINYGHGLTRCLYLWTFCVNKNKCIFSYTGHMANNAWTTVANWITSSPTRIEIREKQRDFYDALLPPFNDASLVQVHDDVWEKPYSFIEDSAITADDATTIRIPFSMKVGRRFRVTTNSVPVTTTGSTSLTTVGSTAAKTGSLAPTQITTIYSEASGQSPKSSEKGVDDIIVSLEQILSRFAANLTTTTGITTVTSSTDVMDNTPMTKPRLHLRHRLPRINLKFWSRKQRQWSIVVHDKIFKKNKIY